jgi:SAM-dependent methyltransferase
MAETSRGCFICGGAGEPAYDARLDPALINDFTYASRKTPELMHYEYFECPDCKMLFATDLPERAKLLAAYEAAAFDSSTESRYAARSYLRALQSILGPGVQSVLDVGCGDGEFLLACREYGIPTLQGIEPSPAASSTAREGIGEVIMGGGYEDQSPDVKFDLVTLFQTIEHIDDPLGFFRVAQQFVRPGGYVAVACHDYRAPVNRIMKDKSPIFDIEHLQIFSSTSIRRTMEKAGLEVISVAPYANTYPLAYWMRLAPIPKAIKGLGIFGEASAGRVAVRLPIGNLMAIARVEGAASPRSAR